MEEAVHPSARVLWVGEDPPPSRRLRISVVGDAEAARVELREHDFDAVIVEAATPELVADVLGAAAASKARRMVVSRYEQLPELVRVVDVGLIQRVLARPATRDSLEYAVLGDDPSASVIYRRALNDPTELTAREVETRLHDIIDRLVDLPTAVIRPLAPREPISRLQLVVPVTDPFQELRRDLPRVLGWPLKAAGSAMGRDFRKHPVRRVLGNLSERQEVYVLGRDNPAYVALFPWGDGSKVTIVLGYEDGKRERVARLHARAVARAREFPLPTRHRKSPLMFYDPDYDWVITKNYVGPDRRRKGTSMLNRYTFRGRRRAIIPNEFRTVGTFVDVAPRWAWYAAGAFAVLFLLDTAMTAYFVGGGEIGELNPVMRWAIRRSPALFWGLKTMLAIAVTFVAIRWHLWRPGRWLFAASIAIYAALDGYWVSLYVSGRL